MQISNILIKVISFVLKAIIKQGMIDGVRRNKIMEAFMKPPSEMNFSTNNQLTQCERWRRWKETMKLYIGLNMSKSSEKEQCVAFRYVIGQEGRDIIYNTMAFKETEVLFFLKKDL